MFAQTPRIGRIEFFGLRKVPESRARKALGLAEGDGLPRAKASVEERLAEVPGIVRAHLEATCCDEGKVVLYVGVEEKGATHFDLRTPPEADIDLPPEITAAYKEFLSAVNEAVRRHQTAEDLTNGHSLMADPDCRDIQLRFVTLAGDHLEELRKVLRNSGDDEQRAIAAYVIGYAPKKRTIVDDLQYALKDADDTVRGNAIRALAAVGVYAKLHPDAEVKIAPTWFIEMLNSLVWTDRNNAAVALVNITESRDPSALDQLRQRALPSLVEMARWQYLQHALPAYILLGRVAGMPETEIQDSWSKGEREKVIAGIVKKFKL
jgi:HEAT repeats